MASLITCTPGGATDNSYLTLLAADTWFANTRRNDAWQSYSDADRERALIEATRDVEGIGGSRGTDTARRPLFFGAPYNSDLSVQCLHFPRTCDTSSTGAVVIPEGIQRAVCEQAYYLLTLTPPDGGVSEAAEGKDLVDFADLQRKGVNSLSIDGLSVSMSGAGAEVPEGIAPAAWAAAKGFLRRGYGIV